MPAAVLLETGLLEDGNCDYAQGMAKFFDQSCVPGAKSPKYDKDDKNPDTLCALCIGDGKQYRANIFLLFSV